MTTEDVARRPISETHAVPFDPHKAARTEIAAAIDERGRPTGVYWQIPGMHAARQTRLPSQLKKRCCS